MKIIRRYEQPGEWEEVIRYDKEREEKKWMGMVRTSEAGEYKLSVRMEHVVAMTQGRVVVRAVVSGGARVEILGMIKIAKEAQGTDSFLELRVLLLDDISFAAVEPQLEIEANEVSAGHAASVSELDESQVQYLQSRGLSRESAEKEIVDGWLKGEW